MNKYAFKPGMSRKKLPSKLLLIMKLIIVFMTTFLIQVSANTFGQRVTLSEKKASLEKMFQKIRKQTGYDFFFDAKIVQSIKPVDIHLNNATIEEALNSLLAGQPLVYEINENSVIIRKKETSFMDRLISKFNRIDIHGVIKDAQGNLMAGASIAVKGKDQLVKTNQKGEFFIQNVDQNDILIVSFIGFVSQEVALKDGAPLEIVLKEQVAVLGEVTVSTGYQNIKSAKVTGAITTIGSEELEKRNVTNLLSNLEGKVPGLVYYNSTVTVRGLSTMQANQQVLVVVDGFPIEGSVADLNPYDIESVSVLKDAAAAAIYGAKASNGVIVVTTKRAKVKGKTVVEFATNYNYFQKPDYSNYNYMTPAQQVDVEGRYYDYWFNRNAAGNPAQMTQTFESNIQSGLSVTPVQYAYYQLAKGQINNADLQSRLNTFKANDFVKDYKNNALSNQLIQQYNLALRTSGERSQSSLVLNYKTDNTGIINAYNRQLNIFFKGSYNLAKWIDVDYGLNMVIGKVRAQNNTEATNPFNVPSYYSLFDATGARSQYSLSYFNVYSTNNTILESTANLYSMKFNHLDELERDYNNTSSRNSRYYVSLNIKPIAGLSIRPQFQYEDNYAETLGYSEKESYTMRYLQNTFSTRLATGFRNLLPPGGRLETSRTNNQSYTARLQTNYDKQIGRGAISFLAGAELRQTRAEFKSSALFGYVDQLQSQASTALVYETLRTQPNAFYSAMVFPSLLYGTDINRFGTRDVIHRFGSGYANLTYTLDGKYNAFGSVRKDYADLYGGDTKFRGRPLWSAGLSWIMSEEKFIKDIKVIDYLKLRSSYGVTGNIDLNYTSKLTANIAGTNTFTREPIANIVIPPNDKLRWEKTSTINIGLDFGLLDQRLRGNFDVYRKKGTDLFARKRLDATLGFSSLVINNGDMLNKGVELGLNYDWFRPGREHQLGWTSSIVISKNKNKITSVDQVASTPGLLAGSGAFTVDHPVKSLYSYQFRGLDATGLPQWLLSDGSLTTSTIPNTDPNAVVFSGGMDPTLSMAFNNEVSFKNFSFSVYAVYYGGHYLRDNAPRLYDEPEYGSLSNTILNSWTPTNTNTTIPGFGEYYQEEANANPMVYADEFVKSADFFKVRNIVLSYSLRPSPIKKLGIANVKFRFQIDNPNFSWTKEELSIDPETGGLRIPTAYVLGVNVNF
ncbi:SusC/RagA family TonB-linked outer membrane protein [Pedobacter sp. ISL-68]|uniref:SusC/RagA family TonB-linked outer membrane protein n=1 Tax=unclassified Pedobacter TaxID=2628915 RepID=UPI001BE658E4|nr:MULTISPECIES: SusC/RagA family TonB-linked outer membrane protein [unclassified Pedobacter]MBT2560198.1 SusC/RagA family TonB-linked outer membrane protein [Pedobacter sp. ISL-64]MBT2589177.1 SusC/RagA family TonB-linked outer membrane protein [Pedobacter sp. ISL-68]